MHRHQALRKQSVPSACAVRFIETFQAQVGPDLDVECQFESSCSVYAHQACHKNGFLKAAGTSLGRLSRCRNY